MKVAALLIEGGLYALPEGKSSFTASDQQSGVYFPFQLPALSAINLQNVNSRIKIKPLCSRMIFRCRVYTKVNHNIIIGVLHTLLQNHLFFDLRILISNRFRIRPFFPGSKS